LKESIKRFGIVDPLVVNSAENRKNIVIGGHFRLVILKELGYKKVPVVYVNIPDIKKEKELNLRLNKNHGEWDMELLANFDEELLKEVGFESEELDKIFDLKIEDSEKEDYVPEVKKTNIKYGDIFQLGQHRLMCGDATKKEDVEKLMNGEKADMVFTDPPYGVEYSSRGDTLRGDTLRGDTLKELPMLLEKSFKNLFDFSSANASVYIWHADQKENIDIIFKQKFTEAGFFCGGKIVWVKNVASMGWNDYRYQYEPCLYGWKGKHKFYGGRDNTNVWRVDRDAVINYKHPTQKPVALAEIAIKNSSKRGDIVLDLFGGSGSTLIACEKLNRRCYMMEIEPIYCQVIIDRWEKFTNKKAQKISEK
jgi:DNA modification methylase